MFRINQIDTGEILRYLGGSQDSRLLSDINRLFGVFEECAAPRHVCQPFTLEKTQSSLRAFSENASIMLCGDSISEFLSGAEVCFIMAATLGLQLDRAILRTQAGSAADGLILDAIANAAIENYVDYVQSLIYSERAQRYSCGYGDLPIELQPKLLEALDAQRKIGLYCNSQNMMIPLKSVTAIIIEGDKAVGANHCHNCAISCEGRTEGRGCGR